MKNILGILLALGISVFSVVAHADVTQGLVAYWPFNGNANDESGNGNNGTINGGATFTADRFGQANKAISLDGVDDFIDIGPNVKPPFPITVSAWVREEGTTDAWGEVFRNDYSNANDYRYGLELWVSTPADNNGYLITQVNEGFSTSTNRVRKVSNQNVVVIGEWHCFTAVFGGPYDQHHYWDGVEIDGYYDGTGSNMTYSGENGAIGKSASSTSYLLRFKGGIDDIRVYNRALSAAEVQELYDLEPTPPWGTPAEAEAASYGSEAMKRSNVFNLLALLLIPVAAVMFLRIARRKN